MVDRFAEKTTMSAERSTHVVFCFSKIQPNYIKFSDDFALVSIEYHDVKMDRNFTGTFHK